VALHFDGPMVAGGLAFPVEEVVAAPAPRPHSTGLEWLDRLTGGIEPGAVWAVIGTAGVGVTRLVARFGVAAAATGEVLLANGHIGTRRLASVVHETARRLGQAGDALPMLASWLPTPAVGDDRWDSDCERAAVVVVDTWDEMWRPGAWPRSADHRIQDARWLRERARAHGTALVLTARLPRWTSPASAEAARHPAHDALVDVADVLVELDVDDGGHRRVLTRVRGGRSSREDLPVGAL
jgi:predicted ATP-dependent serine protease